MIENLRSMFLKGDRIDYVAGLTAYSGYHEIMRAFSDIYKFPLDRVVAAFVSLSPNNDYKGNLRSLITLLQGINEGKPLERINTSTYRHALGRAYAYATGAEIFLERTNGLKIRSFYHNIMDPNSTKHVTVDGHMCAIWRGQNLTMKEAIIRSTKEYRDIEYAIKALAFELLILPNQYQATLWFIRKRVSNVVYSPQLDLFANPWQAFTRLQDLKPFEDRTP